MMNATNQLRPFRDDARKQTTLNGAIQVDPSRKITGSVRPLSHVNPPLRPNKTFNSATLT